MAMTDHRTTMTSSSVVPKKGVHPYAVVRLCNDISLLGYTRIILKSGNESSIMALKELVKAESSQKTEVTCRINETEDTS